MRNRVAREAILAQQVPERGEVGIVGECLSDLEMVAPAGEFDAVVAHGGDFREQFGNRQIGPLAGEECDGAWHGRIDG